jgi:hypothetical protein
MRILSELRGWRYRMSHGHAALFCPLAALVGEAVALDQGSNSS